MSERTYPPGPSNWRRVLLDIQKDPLQFLIQLQHDYGNFVHYRHGPAHVFFVNTPELIREVLVTQNDLMQRTHTVQRSLGKFLGNGLLISSGSHHHSQRQLLQPLFTPISVASYDQLIVKQTEKIVAEWRSGEQRNLMPDMHNLTMNILYQAIFGLEDISLGAEIHAAIGTLQRYAGEMIQRTPQMAEAECDLAVQKFDAAFETLLKQKRKSDLLSLLLNSGMPLANVRDEIVTLMVAGQETSAHGLTWLWYLLALHPEIQERMYQEIKSVLKGAPLTADLLTQMPFVTNTIRESLRFYPPAWLIGRSPTQPVILNGYFVNPEDTIIISPYVLHHTAEYFPDPERFDPDRFLTEPPRYTYLPFGAGPHICLGQPFASLEMALILASVVTQWRLRPATEVQVEWLPLVTLQPAHRMEMIVEKRVK